MRKEKANQYRCVSADASGPADGRGIASRRRKKTVLVALSLVIVTLAAYWQVSGNDFVHYDDREYLTANRHLEDGLTWQGVRWAFTTFHANNWHPLTWMSHMLDVSLFGKAPGGHHVSSLVLHMLNTILLFGFLSYTTRKLWPSAFVAGLFALHPLHVESVAWIAERKDVLSAFFWLCTMWAYLFYTRRPGIPRYLLVVLLFAAGLMSKPMLVTLPLALLLLDYWPLERLSARVQDNAGRLRLILLEKLPLLAMAAASSLITVMAQQSAMATLDSTDMPTRLTNALVSYGRYILEMVWPAGLAVHYPYPDRPVYAGAAVMAAVLAAATWLALHYGRRSRYLAAGWLWYLVTLVPVIGVVQVGGQSHADRYTYITLTGIFVIVAFGAAEWLERRPVFRKVAAVAAAAVLLTASMLTWLQVGYWKDSLTLYRRAASVTKNNSRILTNMAIVMMDGGRLDEAIIVLREAVEAVPKDEMALGAYGIALSRKGLFEEALGVNRRAVEIAPQSKVAQAAAGANLVKLRRFNEAEPFLRTALKIDNEFPYAWAQLGVVMQHTGRIDEAIVACDRAVRLEPDLALGHLALAGALLKKGDLVAAAESYRRTVELAPDFAAWFNLAGCLARTGRPADAEQAYVEALKLEPDNSEARELLAELRRR